MRITVDSPHSLAAVLIGAIGFALIALTIVETVGDDWSRMGFALIVVGGIVWLHGQINRIVDRMTKREDAAFNFGKLAAVRKIP